MKPGSNSSPGTAPEEDGIGARAPAEIPVCEPRTGARELRAVTRCVKSGWVSSGAPQVAEFERRWASYCGRAEGVAVSSGTAALQTALACLDLRPGDEVILPAFTIMSCLTAVLYNGAKPVLVDVDPETWTLDPAHVAAKLTRRTRAVMPVHIYGHPCDMDPLLALAARRRLAVVEDAAEAHGAGYKGRRCGGFGDLSAFSFFANKLVSTGEGGMLLTDDASLARKARDARNLGFGRAEKFRHESLGHNFRVTGVQAALGLAQLASLESAIRDKRRVRRLYADALAGVEGLRLAPERPWARSVHWMIAATLEPAAGLDAKRLAGALAARGIETRPFFLGMHEQPVLRRMGLFRGESYPVTERIARQGLLLPSGTALTQGQVARVADEIKDALAP